MPPPAPTLVPHRHRAARARRPWGAPEVVGAFLMTSASGYGPIRYMQEHGPDAVDTVTWPGHPLWLVALAAGCVLLVSRLVMTGAHAKAPRAAPSLLILLSALALTVSFMRYQPSWSVGSDRAEALDVGLRLLLAGENPYTGTTSLGNTLSPMLGGIILAAPIALVFGSLLLQGPIWLGVTTGSLAAAGGLQAAAAAAALLAASPAIRLELVTRSDGWVNAAALVVFGIAGYHAALATRNTTAAARAWIALAVTAALFGLAMAYRFILAIAFLPVLVLLVRQAGRTAAVTWAAVSGTVATTLAVLPWLADPDRYAPLTKAGHADSPLHPWWAEICALVSVLVLIALSARVRTLPGAFAAAAAALLALLAMVAIGQGSVSGYVVVSFTGAWLVFGVAALVLPRRVAPPLIP